MFESEECVDSVAASRAFLLLRPRTARSSTSGSSSATRAPISVARLHTVFAEGEYRAGGGQRELVFWLGKEDLDRR